MASQVALSFVLLLGSGLLLQSFLNLRKVEMGFGPQGVQTFELSIDETEGREQRWPRARSVLELLGTIPGIEAAGAVSTGPPPSRECLWGARDRAAPAMRATRPGGPRWGL